MVLALQVLAISGTQLTVPVEVDKRAVDMVVDTGSPVSLLPKYLVRNVELKAPERDLCAYGGTHLQVLGKCEVNISCKGKQEKCHVYVVPFGSPIMGLDLMDVFSVNVVDNIVCNVLQTPAHPDPEAAGQLYQPEPVQTSPPPPILGYQHRVTVDPTVRPVQQPLRRLPWAVKDEVSARLDQLEREGVIEKVTASEWVSPIVVGRKRDGGVRLCVDMRQVNRAVVTDGYPLPRIEDVLHRLNRSKFFSRFDLKDAYHQLDLHPESRPLTTFVTHQGLYRFTRVNFGLASAGPCFQRVMNSIVGGITGVEVYLDDVVVHAPTQAEHDARVKAVLNAFERHRVRVNWEKSRPCSDMITFLGYMISAKGISIDRERVAPLLDAPEPTDDRSLRAFLGSVSYHARFISGFSTLVEPLRAVLREDAFRWGPELSDTVRRVKEAIRDAPTLSMFDPQLKTVLTTDASDVGCGAYLSQLEKDGGERVISYASRAFTSAERSYSVIEKEALSCVWAMEKWRTYLWGRRFIL